MTKTKDNSILSENISQQHVVSPADFVISLEKAEELIDTIRSMTEREQLRTKMRAAATPVNTSSEGLDKP